MKYKFSESVLGTKFREDIVIQIRTLIETGSSFNLIGMPFVGISPFFRYLACTDIACFIYLDVHALLERSKQGLFISLRNELGGKGNTNAIDAFEDCKVLLRSLLKKHNKVVILLNRFDYLDKDTYANGIFSNLKSLEDIGKRRIIFVAATSKPLYDLDENGIIDSNLAFFSKIVFFPPYKGSDLEKLLLVSPTALKPNPKDIQKALLLSGGHATLLQVLIKTEYFEAPMQDSFLRLHLKVILDACTTSQKNILNKLALGKRVKVLDPFLISTGIIIKDKDKVIFFSELFKDYLLSYAKLKLTKKESKLFYILKKHLGKTVSKDVLFKHIWEDYSDTASDWALNALIYRLRKNPTLRSSKYIIENEKDVGYRMFKE